MKYQKKTKLHLNLCEVSINKSIHILLIAIKDIKEDEILFFLLFGMKFISNITFCLIFMKIIIFNNYIFQIKIFK